jgi:hypothetical protein
MPVRYVPGNPNAGDTDTFDVDTPTIGPWELIELSALRTAGAGWLVNDTLVFTVDITVQREDRFQLDTGVCRCTIFLPCFRAACQVCVRVCVPQACLATWASNCRVVSSCRPSASSYRRPRLSSATPWRT